MKRKKIKCISDFDNNYCISIKCHICPKQFDTLDIYKCHLKQHYDNDHLRTWLKCDLGCKDKLFSCFAHFMPHIASHTRKYPFKCNKCLVTTSTKSNMKNHWNKQHN
eukprot:99900_1